MPPHAKGSRRLGQSFRVWYLAKRIPFFLEAPVWVSHDLKVIVLTWSLLLVAELGALALLALSKDEPGMPLSIL